MFGTAARSFADGAEEPVEDPEVSQYGAPLVAVSDEGGKSARSLRVTGRGRNGASVFSSMHHAEEPSLQLREHKLHQELPWAWE